MFQNCEDGGVSVQLSLPPAIELHVLHEVPPMACVARKEDLHNVLGVIVALIYSLCVPSIAEVRAVDEPEECAKLQTRYKVTLAHIYRYETMYRTIVTLSHRSITGCWLNNWCQTTWRLLMKLRMASSKHSSLVRDLHTPSARSPIH